MHSFQPPPPPPKRHRAFGLWLLLATLALGPSALVWIVRGGAFALGCEPGPAPCHGLALGIAFRETLRLAWMLGLDSVAPLALGIAAAIAALFARRPLLAALSALVLPLGTLVLPTLAVFATTYDGCAANEAGLGACTLWGAEMGMSVHSAALAPWLLYAVVPYSVAAAIMLGLIGFLFCRAPQ